MRAFHLLRIKITPCRSSIRKNSVTNRVEHINKVEYINQIIRHTYIQTNILWYIARVSLIAIDFNTLNQSITSIALNKMLYFRFLYMYMYMYSYNKCILMGKYESVKHHTPSMGIVSPDYNLIRMYYAALYHLIFNSIVLMYMVILCLCINHYFYLSCILLSGVMILLFPLVSQHIQ